MAERRAVRIEDVVCAAASQVSSRVGDEAAILHLDRAAYYGLDPVGARIWELVQLPIRLDEVHAAVVDEYDVDGETARRDLLEVVEQLLEAGLVEVRGGDAP